jgi:3-methyl-2-oxobutanoate hydroxymethyltransferase
MTAHDYPSGAFCDKAGMDVVLVGDSLAMVSLGLESTAEISVDEMLHHCRAVSRGARMAFKVGDMPFGSYQVSDKEAVRNAIRFIQEGQMEVNHEMHICSAVL